MCNGQKTWLILREEIKTQICRYRTYVNKEHDSNKFKKTAKRFSFYFLKLSNFK